MILSKCCKADIIYKYPHGPYRCASCRRDCDPGLRKNVVTKDESIQTLDLGAA